MRYLVIVWWHEPIIGEYSDLDAARKDYDRAVKELNCDVTFASVISATSSVGDPLTEWVFEVARKRH